MNGLDAIPVEIQHGRAEVGTIFVAGRVVPRARLAVELGPGFQGAHEELVHGFLGACWEGQVEGLGVWGGSIHIC